MGSMELIQSTRLSTDLWETVECSGVDFPYPDDVTAVVSILVNSNGLGKLIADCQKNCIYSPSDNLRFSITETQGCIILVFMDDKVSLNWWSSSMVNHAQRERNDLMMLIRSFILLVETSFKVTVYPPLAYALYLAAAAASVDVPGGKPEWAWVLIDKIILTFWDRLEFSLAARESIVMPVLTTNLHLLADLTMLLQAWDLIKLVEYLTTQREDIDPFRIGITGESLGGMHAWFAAAADTRYAVTDPIIGVQGFKCAIDHDKWQARVDSIQAVFEEARIGLGKGAIDKEVVEKVWDRIAPSLASKFDSLHIVPLIAPRPLLLLNGEEDPHCPVEGLKNPVSRTCKVYEGALCLDNFKLIAEPGIGHQMTKSMVKEASDWFDKYLLMK